jgi:hypothetical protein
VNPCPWLMNHFPSPSSNQWLPSIHEPMTIGRIGHPLIKSRWNLHMQWNCLLPLPHLNLRFYQPSILIVTHKVGWRPPLFITRNIFIFHPRWGHTIFPLSTMVRSLSLFFPQCTPILPRKVLVSPSQSSYDFSHFFIYSTPTPRFNLVDLRLNGF